MYFIAGMQKVSDASDAECANFLELCLFLGFADDFSYVIARLFRDFGHLCVFKGILDCAFLGLKFCMCYCVRFLELCFIVV